MREMIELLATIVRETKFEDKSIGTFTSADLQSPALSFALPNDSLAKMGLVSVAPIQ